MKTATVTWQNEYKTKTSTATFDIYVRSELTSEQRYELIGKGAELLAQEEWEDEDFARIEKQAVIAAGIAAGTPVLVMQK